MRVVSNLTQDRSIPMTDETVSPLRRRMIEDMSMRRLAPKTQKDYIQVIKNLAVFIGRSPDTASFEDIRRFQLHVAANGVGAGAINRNVSALRFFFRVTLKRYAIVEHTHLIHEPRKLPVILNPEEVVRLLDAAPGLRYKAALSVAYGAGLRAAEVVALKVSDIDSKRMLIRVEQGKGRKDRNVMLSPHLLEVLRAWWKAARPQGWLFPGRDPVKPMTTRQLNRACHAAAQLAEINKRVSLHTLRHSFATHLLEQNTDIRVIQVLLGHAKLENTALYTRVATKTISQVVSPLERIALQKQAEPPALKRGTRVASGAGGRGYLPRPWTGMAASQCRPCEPRPVEGDVGDRELPDRGSRRPCRALRGLCLHDHCLQQLP
jgi:integrase/recombinase XerD